MGVLGELNNSDRFWKIGFSWALTGRKPGFVVVTARYAMANYSSAGMIGTNH